MRDGYGLHTKSRPLLRRLHCDWAGMVKRNSARMMCLSDIVHIKLKASETNSCAGHCKQTVPDPSNRLHTDPSLSEDTSKQSLKTYLFALY